MKTNIFLSLLVVAILSTFSLNATNPDKKVFQNIEISESGSVKELISFKNNGVEPESKVVYYYGVKGELQKKVIYKWSDRKGWESYKKYNYEYNTYGKVANLFYTEWDKKLDAWSPKSIQFVHVYDDNGKFFAMKKIENNDEKSYSYFIAGK